MPITPRAELLRIPELVDYQDGSIVSRISSLSIRVRN